MALTVEDVPLAATAALRSSVLREGRPHEGFPEDGEPTTIHLGGFEDGRLVGVATFIPRAGGEWQLQAMAVDESCQGRGVGRAVLAEGERRLRAAA